MQHETADLEYHRLSGHSDQPNIKLRHLPGLLALPPYCPGPVQCTATVLVLVIQATVLNCIKPAKQAPVLILRVLSLVCCIVLLYSSPDTSPAPPNAGLHQLPLQ